MSRMQDENEVKQKMLDQQQVKIRDFMTEREVSQSSLRAMRDYLSE